MTTTQTYTHIADNEEVQVLCQDHGIDHEAFAVYCDNHHIDSDYESEVAGFIDSYRGEYNDFADFAEQLFDETVEVPDHLVGFIDYKAWARELRHDYWETNGHVFFSI
jgi:antirestriction protein